MKSFAELFKKYRLRAEFETFSAFGDALAEKDYYYDDSIFSHWQKGTRIPKDRKLLLKILEIFIEKESIKTTAQANEILESVGLGYLTEEELIFLPLLQESVFQIPHEITDFTGRDEVISDLLKEKLQGKTVLIYGPAGIGKTTLAIKLGHLLKQQFPDGVLWYRMDTSKFKDILISIAHLLKEDLPQSNDIEIIASFIRSVLARKKILLIFDNVEKENDLHLLLPFGSSSSIILSSRHQDLYLPTELTTVSLESFSDTDVLILSEKMFEKSYVKRHKEDLLRLGKMVGNLPLAVHVLASQLKQSGMSLEALLEQGERQSLSLHRLSYENKNLSVALEVSYRNLSKKEQAVFLSFGAFEGKDFSIDAIAYMNGMSKEQTEKVLEELHNESLIETSLNKKFRIHPMVKKFIAEKLANPYISLFHKIIFLIFSLFTIYWIYLQTTKVYDFFSQHMFSSTYFIVALWGGFLGLKIAQKWGGFKSVMGKAISLFSLGLFLQVVGQVSYAYCIIVLDIALPYPSFGDIGFLTSDLVYTFSIILLAKASGVKFNLSTVARHVFILLIYIALLFGMMVLLLQEYIFDWSNSLKIFFDFAYPLVDSIYTFLVLLLYVELVKGKKNIMKNKILFFFVALSIQFLADYNFIYQANNGTWQPGQINDYLYFFAFLMMTFAILRLNSGLSKVVVDQ